MKGNLIHKRKHIHKGTLIDFVFSFALVYLTRSMWSTIPSIVIINRLMKFLLCLVVCLRLLFSRGKIINKKKFTIFVFLVLYLFLFALFDTRNITAYLRTLITCLLVIFFVLESKKEDMISVLKQYEMIILIFAAISFVIWVTGPMLNIISSSGYIMTTWSGTDDLLRVKNYYYLLFTPQSGNFFSITRIVRNTGIFTEAPMYSLHLSVALLVELFVKKKINIRNVLILVVSIVSSLSMTGYIAVVLAFAFKYVGTGEKKTIRQAIKVFSIPVIIIVAINLVYIFLQQRIGTGSGNARLDDYLAGYKAWRDAPLIGNGYGNAESYIQYMSSFRLNSRGFSNSPMQILAYGGLYLFLPYVIGFVKAFKNAFGDTNKLSLAVIFLYLFIMTVIPFQPLTFFLLSFLSLDENPDKGVIKKRRLNIA